MARRLVAVLCALVVLAGACGDDGPPTETAGRVRIVIGEDDPEITGKVQGLAVGKDDVLYVALAWFDDKDNVLLAVTHDGDRRVVLDRTRRPEFSPTALAADPATGVVYVADGDSSFSGRETGVILALEPGGEVRELVRYPIEDRPAGAGELPSKGQEVRSLALDAEGGALYADTSPVSRIDVETGEFDALDAGQGGDEADGVHVSEAFIGTNHLAFDPVNRALYFTTLGTVRRVDSRGTVTTVAGVSRESFESSEESGDGRPAKEARFESAFAVAVDPRDGTVYVSDHRSGWTRRIAVDGVITRVVSNGEGDGAHYRITQVLAVDSQGRLYLGGGVAEREVASVDFGSPD